MEKKLKILKEKIENLKILLIALKNNIKFKEKYNNYFSIDNNNNNININFNEINDFIEIIKNNYNDYYIFLIQNLNNIIKKYKESIIDIKEEINKINTLIFNKYSTHLLYLFNNNNNNIIQNDNKKDFYYLINYENFMLKFSKLNLNIDFSLYLSNSSQLISNINNIYTNLSNLL